MLDTLRANLEHCVGMAANMIGVKKNIIVVAAGPFQFVMINSIITKKFGVYQTEEGCLSLKGVRSCTSRYLTNAAVTEHLCEVRNSMKSIQGDSTDLAVYQAAGAEELLMERKKIGCIERGDIAVTGAYALNAKYIIHTVGPVWVDGKHNEVEDFAIGSQPEVQSHITVMEMVQRCEYLRLAGFIQP